MKSAKRNGSDEIYQCPETDATDLHKLTRAGGVFHQVKNSEGEIAANGPSTLLRRLRILSANYQPIDKKGRSRRRLH